MVMLPSSMEPTVEGLPCPGKKGRTLQYTLIFPIYKKHINIRTAHFSLSFKAPNLCLFKLEY
jgi:hypothetical protein